MSFGDDFCIGISSLPYEKSVLLLLLLLLQVGFLNSGKVVALDVYYYSNAGNSSDLSLSVSIVLTTEYFLISLYTDGSLMLLVYSSRSWSALCCTWRTPTAW